MPASGPDQGFAYNLGDQIADQILKDSSVTAEAVLKRLQQSHVHRPMLFGLDKEWDIHLETLDKAIKDDDREAIRKVIKELVWTCHCEW